MRRGKESYKYSELLDDRRFIDWVTLPTDELDSYWEQRMSADPDLAQSIASLKFIIGNLRTEENRMSGESKARIRNRLLEYSLNAAKRLRMKRLIRIGASAAAVLLIAGCLWMYRQGQQNVTQIDYRSFLAERGDGEQSGNVELILGQNSRVEIDSADVDIVYSGTGEISINSAKIEKTREAELNRLIVPYGKTSSVTLSDGSRIWVNSGSRIVYPLVFESGKREIYVEGEVFLEVARNKQPFLIKTDNIEISVLGTRFNVSAYHDEDEHSVVLVSGSVTVADISSGKTYKIRPDQKYTLNAVSGDVDIREVDVDEYVSWKSGFWTFRSKDLATVIGKLERHYNVKFLYAGDDLGDIRVSGKLNLKDDIEDVLKAISITTPIHYIIAGNTIELEF